MLAALLISPSCSPTTIDPVPDPNNPGIDSVIANATPIQISALFTGLEAVIRLGHTNNAPFYQMAGVMSREVIVLASNEPRWAKEILGTKGALDNAAFYSVGSYDSFTRAIRAAQILRQSAQGTVSITDGEKQAVYGFADTYEALAKLYVLDLMGENGIRIDVANFLVPGKFTAGSAPALANIRQLLETGAAELAKGTDFTFGLSSAGLSSGYTGFDTPASFLTFNRGLAARVALYQGKNSEALNALKTSFYNPGATNQADLAVGPKITFNPGISGDQGNAYFQKLNASPSTLVVVPDNFVTEAEAGDKRLSKVSQRTTPKSLFGITANYEPASYISQTQTLDIIRNEELILISAEAKAKTGDFTGAIADINVIRTVSGGLPAYTGTITQDALVNEVLKQRRYSLFYEGQFWIDLRRLGKLNAAPTPDITLPYAATPYMLFSSLVIPQAEASWDQAHP